METILIASSNPGKLREFQSILQDIPIQLVLPSDIGVHLNIVEDGNTYLENAQKKAQAYCKASGLITLADDSGLEVDALNGAPGLYSARYAPQTNATDADRRLYLLEQLTGKPQPWRAHFHCTVVIATPAGEEYHHTGNCYGQIWSEERGTGGFGYDPIFYLDDLNKTMAEISSDEKNQRSHRALAVLDAVPTILRLTENK
jgi:XTP/dITP diphosphohydrolase